MDRVPDADIRLGRTLLAARLFLLWERAWPRLAIVLAVLAVYAILAWFGAFESLPRAARLGVLAVFGLALLGALFHLILTPFPTILDAVGRLDRDIGKPHRPATAAVDVPANIADDPVSRALWAAHGRSARAATQDVRLAAPAPGLPARDPMAFRVALVLAAVVAFFFAGPERVDRLLTVFREPPAFAAEAAVRIDAWVTPPAYTRRPPQLLSAADPEGPPIAVPQGSLLVVRVAGDPAAVIDLSGSVGEPPVAANAGSTPPAGVVERRAVLNGDVRALVKRGDVTAAAFRFSILPDKAPTIALQEPIRPSIRGAMSLTYKIEDDYGATGAQALFSRPSAGTRPLYDPPTLSLPVPAAGARDGVVTATRDVSQHPFAGADMSMTLVARDAAGNEGRSEPISLVLPGRAFSNPLARSLVELRRTLALDAGAKAWVGEALDALMVAPEMFTRRAGVYLGLVSARQRLANAQTDAELRGVVDYLWTIALRLEEGDASDAERDLKTAQERLRDAIERGASEEEIKRLTQELREAMNRFLNELARQQAQNRNENPLSRSNPQDQQMVTQDQLNSMLDRMEQAMRNGAREDAQQLLSDLNNLLDNLQSGQQEQTADDRAAQEMQRSMDELGSMLQRQQRLRDETFQQGQNRSGEQGEQGQQGQQDGQGMQGQSDGQGEQGQQGESGQQGNQAGRQPGQGGGEGSSGFGGLRQRQEALRRQLDSLQRRMNEMGAAGAGALGEAQQAMRDAEGQLGQGDGQGATESQGRAIESLRKGAQSLAQQMQQQGQGQAGRPSQGRNGRAERGGEGAGNGDDRDPLGRPTRARSYTDGTVKVPGRGETAAERAARVLEELRRRLSDPSRPQYELDYIDRLLRRD